MSTSMNANEANDCRIAFEYFCECKGGIDSWTKECRIVIFTVNCLDARSEDSYTLRKSLILPSVRRI